MAVAAAREGRRLLEREAVLESLRESLSEARRGRGRLVLVSGEAGVGKSAAVREFCEGVRGSARVLWGGCDPLFTPRPLGPFVDIAEDAGAELREAVEKGPPEVVAAVLRSAGPRSAAVVVVEDVHWADEATLDALRLLGRKLGQAPLLVVATYRDEELDRVHPLRLVLGELASHRYVERLPVLPLSPEAVAELAGSLEVDAVELHRLTGGNAFFVTEVLASGSGAIPSTVRDAVLARAARLSERARAVLDAAAIAPPQVELWLLEALAGEQMTALEECLSSGMLIEVAVGSIAFRHELARLAIEESIEPQRRLRLHRAALAALAEPQAGHPDSARLAHHADAAGDGDAVLRFAPAAAERAGAAGAHREAAAQYARALRFGDRLPVAERASLLERRSRECLLNDEHDAAIEAIEKALECRRRLGQRLEEGAALCFLSEILICPGRNAESERTGREAVALLEGLPPGRELAMAYANLAARCMDQILADEAVRWGYRALELAEQLGETDVALDASVTIGVCDANERGRLEETLDRAREAGFPQHVGRAFLTLIGTAVVDRRHDLAARYLEPAIEYCGEHGLELYRYYILAFRARIELEQGRWVEATDSAEHVLRLRRTSIAPKIWALAVLGLVRARRGDPGDRPPLEEALAFAEPAGDLFRMWPVATARAEAAWLRGDHAEVLTASKGVFEDAVAREWAWVAGELALWRRRAGVEEPVPAGIAEPYAHQLADEWARAAALWRELGFPYEAALALADAEEEEPLRRALEQLQALGARPAAAIVARRLNRMGVRNVPRGPRPGTRENTAQLTARELDVLRLMAEGCRNAAIAERLFLSPRTVERHVSSVLSKLHVQSRGEAVAAAARLGLLQNA